MAYGFTDLGERNVLIAYFGEPTLNMTLYSDADDQLTDTDTTDEITTEPSGSNFTRADITSSDTSVSTKNGDAVLDVSAQAFDVSDSTENVDSYAFINDSGELVHRGPIDTSDRSTEYVDLDQNDDVLLGGEPTTFG